MATLFLSQILAVVALAFCLAAFAVRLRTFVRLARLVDRSTPRGSASAGVVYALSQGMMPWAKESTRRHALAYLRGVGFHLTVAISLVVFLVSPWLSDVPTIFRNVLAGVTGIGALLAFLGFLSRFTDKSLKALSTPDDYFAILLVSLYLAVSALALWNLALLPLFYLFTALVLGYMPFGKIRHCIYFAFSRMFFGKFFGRRGVYPHNQQELLV
jgi:nitrate reductase gamma subunit